MWSHMGFVEIGKGCGFQAKTACGCFRYCAGMFAFFPLSEQVQLPVMQAACA